MFRSRTRKTNSGAADAGQGQSAYLPRKRGWIQSSALQKGKERKAKHRQKEIKGKGRIKGGRNQRALERAFGKLLATFVFRGRKIKQALRTKEPKPENPFALKETENTMQRFKRSKFGQAWRLRI